MISFYFLVSLSTNLEGECTLSASNSMNMFLKAKDSRILILNSCTAIDFTGFNYFSNLMENEEFRKFFNKQSTPKINWDTITMFMHLYNEIDNRWPELDKYQKTEAMKRLIDDGEYRRIITSEFRKLK